MDVHLICVIPMPIINRPHVLGCSDFIYYSYFITPLNIVMFEICIVVYGTPFIW